MRTVQTPSPKPSGKATDREERPQQGLKNLTNVLRITSKEWLAWIKLAPVGCKDFTATENIDSRTAADRLFPRFAGTGAIATASLGKSCYDGPGVMV